MNFYFIVYFTKNQKCEIWSSLGAAIVYKQTELPDTLCQKLPKSFWKMPQLAKKFTPKNPSGNSVEVRSIYWTLSAIPNMYSQISSVGACKTVKPQVVGSSLTRGNFFLKVWEGTWQCAPMHETPIKCWVSKTLGVRNMRDIYKFCPKRKNL